ncbi:substrate-binding periplasmic protein [Neptuniibacter caesariensis]|uniref:Solute-binding protein family 3/N-terminal domain-containing protein n=1 Tax=Neptuniibacter caesariensis TaxID=207954 RepID=A0A7U8C582_NEPCE|nr:hypothetical protein [Neptuniibacter caesariensis]EAR60961.1 hypothetical protein MED92_02141 [Oceanospirillum sp. MED92] [Neptuniibacter caesariensis]
MFRIWLVTLMVAISHSAFAQEELEYAYPDISVWTTQRDEKGKLKNPLVKFAEPLFKAAGIPWHPKDYPAKRMFANLRNGTSKFSMLVNAKSLLQDCCLVSKEPVAKVEINIFYREGSEPVASIEELRGKSVITIAGYSYAGYRKYIDDPDNGITNMSTQGHFSAFGMLQRGRAEYVLDYAYPAAEVLAENPISNIRFSTLKQTDVFLILHKDYPDAEKTMRKLETIAAGLEKSPYLYSPELRFAAE